MSSLDLLHTLLQAPSESEVLEFKKAETRFDFEKLGQYFSALSNEANLRGLSRARLILGVDDKSHEVVGTNAFLDHKKLHSLKKGIADQTTGRVSFVNIHEVSHPNGRVIMFEINETDQKGEYIIQKGLDDDHYKQLIVELISQFRAASRKDIDNLLIDKLPEIMDEEQKLNKIRNLIQVLSRNGQIYNEGTRSNPSWRIGKSKIDS